MLVKYESRRASMLPFIGRENITQFNIRDSVPSQVRSGDFSYVTQESFDLQDEIGVEFEQFPVIDLGKNLLGGTHRVGRDIAQISLIVEKVQSLYSPVPVSEPGYVFGVMDGNNNSPALSKNVIVTSHITPVA
jgi:hypothetical protein